VLLPLTEAGGDVLMEAHVPFEVEMMDVERDVTDMDRDVETGVPDVERDVGTAAAGKDGLEDVSFGVLVSAGPRTLARTLLSYQVPTPSTLCPAPEILNFLFFFMTLKPETPHPRP